MRLLLDLDPPIVAVGLQTSLLLCIVTSVRCDPHNNFSTSAFIPLSLWTGSFRFCLLPVFLPFICVFLFFLIWFLCNDVRFFTLRWGFFGCPTPSFDSTFCNLHVPNAMRWSYGKAHHVPPVLTWEWAYAEHGCTVNTRKIETGFDAIKRTAQVQRIYFFFFFFFFFSL